MTGQPKDSKLVNFHIVLKITTYFVTLLYNSMKIENFSIGCVHAQLAAALWALIGPTNADQLDL